MPVLARPLLLLVLLRLLLLLLRLLLRLLLLRLLLRLRLLLVRVPNCLSTSQPSPSRPLLNPSPPPPPPPPLPSLLQLDYPAPYTTCVQELACGSWVFPGADGSWLCAKRGGGGAAGCAEGDVVAAGGEA